MANIATEINGVAVTLIDNLDGTYRIDLDTRPARQFIRAELDQLRAAKATLAAERDGHEADRVKRIAQRDSAITAKSGAVAQIAGINPRIDELVAFLQGVGDPT